MPELRPYQVEGRDFLAERRFALLADEMRVGKTPQAILAAHKVGAKRILVVCPAIAVPQWRAEIKRWWPGETLPEATIVSFDRARLSLDTLTLGRWDLLIVDEAHFARKPTAARTKAVYGKGGLAWRANRTWALTGTPAPRDASDLWPMLRAFGVVALDYDAYLSRFCVVDRETNRILGSRTSALPELRGILAPFTLRRTRAQVAPNMPPISFNTLPVEAASGFAVLPGAPCQSPDELIDWLNAHANDPASLDTRAGLALAKAPSVVEHVAFALDNRLLDRTVIFGFHRDALHAARVSLMARGIKTDVLVGATSAPERVRIQDRFKAGETQVVCANIIAAGTAIDLSVARHGFFLELDWLPGNNAQAASRFVSLDRADPVTIDVATVPGSIDEAINAVLIRRSNELRRMW